MKRTGYVTVADIKSELSKVPGMAELMEVERANIHAANLIREARESAHLTQSALAKKIHVSQARIAKMESGGAPYGPSLELLQRIVRACGRTLHLSLS
jgi:DNA-binding XRE family transcriptional regulator